MTKRSFRAGTRQPEVVAGNMIFMRNPQKSRRNVNWSWGSSIGGWNRRLRDKNA